MAAGPKHTLLPLSDPPPRDESLFKGSGMTRRAAAAAVSYMSCAVLLVLFNKAALSSYNFPCANVITLFQMLCSTSILYAMRRWKIISFMVGEPWTVSDNSSACLVPLSTLLHTLPLSVTYLLYMLASMESVRGVNVPMYTTLRRTTVVFTMIVEYLLSGQKYSTPVFGRFEFFCHLEQGYLSCTRCGKIAAGSMVCHLSEIRQKSLWGSEN